ncbi:ribonuclease H family protein [Microvirga pudoricolor]|uniref:ribonuclease H family protein n=1 Tax=Microvirga pudoricolor TaxID=2778729 RepID=UPI001950D885|nr:ribonuclease H [Microvirga pudoricolor]MBM6592917.1 ribonuclease HI [Microvirga pudoricolor]
MMQAVIYTDGACIGSGGGTPGGFAAIIRTGEEERIVTGRCSAATSTAMELMGVIAALEALVPGLPAAIHTDSRYVITGATERLPWWRSRRWRIVKGGKVANRDLWQRLSDLIEDRAVTWHWVRGHAGDPLNERAHALAFGEASRARDERPKGD